MNSETFRLSVATQMIGAPSQRWISRQLSGFSSFDARVLAWEQPGATGISNPIDLVGTNPEPHAGRGRWRTRARHIIDGNYFGAYGEDRRSIRRILQQQQPDVVLSHFGHMGLRLLPVVTELSIPMVVHFHGMDLSSMLRKWFYRTSLHRWGSSFSASVVVGSHQIEILRSFVGDTQPIHLIPCGVPTNQFVRAPRTPPNRLTFICVGRLVAQKGLQVTLRAFAQLDKTLPPTKLLIVGDGPERHNLQSLSTQLNVSDRVTFTGNLTETEVRARLQSADIFVQSSLRDASGAIEGFGVAITEAAAMNLPVIATRIGGIPDQVIDGETGVLVDPGDVGATTGAMTRLLLNAEERQTMGDQGRKQAETLFDTANQISKLEDLLRSIIVHRGES